MDTLFAQLVFFDDEEGGLFLQSRADADDAYAVAYYDSPKGIMTTLGEKGWTARTVAQARAFVERHTKQRIAYFSSIEVQSARGLGLGWRMVARMEQEFKTRGVVLVILHAERRAIPFWVRQGYRFADNADAHTSPLPLMYKRIAAAP